MPSVLPACLYVYTRKGNPPAPRSLSTRPSDMFKFVHLGPPLPCPSLSTLSPGLVQTCSLWDPPNQLPSRPFAEKPSFFVIVNSLKIHLNLI